MINNFEDMVKRLNIYNVLTFNLTHEIEDQKLISADVLNSINDIIVPKNNKVYLKCIECGDYHTFYVHSHYYTYNNSNDAVKKNDNIEVGYNQTPYKYRRFSMLHKINTNENYNHLNSYECYADYLLRCSHDNSHIQLLQIKIIFENGIIKLVKIAQDPINIDLLETNNSTYIKQLNKFGCVQDYRDASSCESRTLYAGAATYLRRIYEKMIHYYLEKNNIDSSKMRMEDKVESIQDSLSDDFINISKKLYTLLSKSIHELSNEEIESYYTYLHSSIEYQLSHQKFLDDQEIQRRKISKKLDQALESLLSKK